MVRSTLSFVRENKLDRISESLCHTMNPSQTIIIDCVAQVRQVKSTTRHVPHDKFTFRILEYSHSFLLFAELHNYAIIPFPLGHLIEPILHKLGHCNVASRHIFLTWEWLPSPQNKRQFRNSFFLLFAFC